LLNVIQFKQELQPAMMQLRYHHQWQPDHIRVEKPYFTARQKAELEKRGFKVSENDYSCRVQMIKRSKNGLEAVSDYRGDGSVSGI
jgi:gamma-glutamyltranspeptidase